MEQGFILFLILILFGVAALFLGVASVIFRLIGMVGRRVAGLLGIRGGTSPLARGKVLVCPNERCRKVERRAAVYCGQCGRRLSEPADAESKKA